MRWTISRAVRMVALVSICITSIALLSGCAIQIGQAQQINTGNGITVHVQVEGDPADGVTVFASLMIHGQGPFVFVVDTGAATTLLNTPVAQGLGLEVAGAPQPVSGVGGAETGTPVNINRWNLGKIHLPDKTIMSADFTESHLGGDAVGLLGSDVWDQFGAVTIDYTNQTLTVYKQIA